MAQSLASFQTKLGYHFTEPARLELALTHRSWTGVQTKKGKPSEALADNERLEFLGDAVLALRISERLLEYFPGSSEGQLSRLRGWLVSARHLATVAEKLHLGSHLRLSRAEESIGGRSKQRLLANGLEAVIGAIHLDGGYKSASEFVDRWLLDPSLESLSPEHIHEFAYKSALQEWTHAAGHPLPSYRVLSSSGPEHGKTFTIEVSIRDVYTGSADGKSKKEAEQKAAQLALAHLGILPTA